MAQNPGIGDLVGDLLGDLLGQPNPIAGMLRSAGQVQHGIAELVRTVERLNETLTQLSGVASRVNTLLDDVEPTVRALAPGMARLAEALAAPGVATLPADLAGFVGTFGDLVNRLQPLTQLAESAGGLFGLRSFGGLFGTPAVPAGTPPVASPPVASPPETAAVVGGAEVETPPSRPRSTTPRKRVAPGPGARAPRSKGTGRA